MVAGSKAKVNMVLQKLIDTPGLSASCGGQKSALDFAFSDEIVGPDRDQWRGIFLNLVKILDLASDQEEVKLVVGPHSVVVRRNQDTYVGVVAQKGHPVVKSLQRMVRRAFKHLGAPMHPSRPRPAPSVTPTQWSTPTPPPAPDRTPFDPQNDPER